MVGVCVLRNVLVNRCMQCVVTVRSYDCNVVSIVLRTLFVFFILTITPFVMLLVMVRACMHVR